MEWNVVEYVEDRIEFTKDLTKKVEWTIETCEL